MPQPHAVSALFWKFSACMACADMLRAYLDQQLHHGCSQLLHAFQVLYRLAQQPHVAP